MAGHDVLGAADVGGVGAAGSVQGVGAAGLHGPGMAGGHKGLGADGLHGLGVDASQQGLGTAGGQHGPGDMAGTGAELELLLLPNTFLQLQNKSPAPR